MWFSCRSVQREFTRICIPIANITTGFDWRTNATVLNMFYLCRVGSPFESLLRRILIPHRNGKTNIIGERRINNGRAGRSGFFYIYDRL